MVLYCLLFEYLSKAGPRYMVPAISIFQLMLLVTAVEAVQAFCSLGIIGAFGT